MESDTTLELIIDGRVVFSSNGKWLHPLFDLERFLKGRQLDLRRAEIHDKIIGRASAFLIVRMGISRVHAGLISTLGRDVLDRAGVPHTWDSEVDVIQCRTETLLRDVTDVEEAYGIVAALEQKSRKPAPSASAPSGATAL